MKWFRIVSPKPPAPVPAHYHAGYGALEHRHPDYGTTGAMAVSAANEALRLARLSQSTANDSFQRVLKLEQHFGGVLKEATNHTWKQVALDSLIDLEGLHEMVKDLQKQLRDIQEHGLPEVDNDR